MSRKLKSESEEKRRKNREYTRKYRQKLTTEEVEQFRKKNRERMKLKRLKSPFSSLDEKSKKKIRAKWASDKYKYRAKLNLKKFTTSENLQTSKKAARRKKVKRDRSEAYRTIDLISNKLVEETRKSEKYRKQAYRLKQKQSKSLSDSPKSKVKSILSKSRGKATFNIFKKLLVGEVFLSHLRKKISGTKSIKEKKKLSNLLVNFNLKKYKLSSEIKNIISC